MVAFTIFSAELAAAKERLPHINKFASKTVTAAELQLKGIKNFERVLERMEVNGGLRCVRLDRGARAVFWADELLTDPEKNPGRTTGPITAARQCPCPNCKVESVIIVLMEEYGIYGGSGIDLPLAPTYYTLCFACTQSHQVNEPR